MTNVTGSTVRCSANLEPSPAIVFMCLNFLSGLLAVIGNLLVLMSVIKTHSLRKTSYYFIASLSLADFLVGLIVNPLYIAITILRVWVSDHPLYKMENFMWIQMLAATSFNLLAVSCDRYIAIMKALRYDSLMTGRRALLAVGVIWVSSVLLAMFSFILDELESSGKLWFSILVLTFVTPLLGITFCYYHIFKAARTQIGRISRDNSPACRQTIKRHRTAKTIALVIVVFVLSFAPNFVFSLLVVFAPSHCQQMNFYRHWSWAIFVAFASSCVNPWIYALRTREFRVAFKRLLRCPCISIIQQQVGIQVEMETVDSLTSTRKSEN